MLPDYIAKKSAVPVLLKKWFATLLSLLLIPILLQIGYSALYHSDIIWIYAILSAPSLIALGYLTGKVIEAKCYTVEFYSNKIILKETIFFNGSFFKRRNQQFIFIAVNKVDFQQDACGWLFHYGRVEIDCRGPYDVKGDDNDQTNKFIDDIKHPEKLVKYLNSRIHTRGIASMIRG